MSNTIDPAVAHQFVGDIKRHLEALLSLKGEYMQRCKTVQELIKDTKDRARDAGIKRKTLNTYLKKCDLESKIEALTDDFDEDEVEDLEMFTSALGGFSDTPLGASAVEKAEARQKERASKVSSLSGDDTTAENVTRLRGGIKQLKGEG